MSSTEYTYSISSDFPNAKVASYNLALEIANSDIATTLERIDTVGDTCNIWFADALSAGDEVLLDGLVAAHAGQHMNMTFIASGSILGAEVSLPSGASWGLLGGIVTNPNFFVGNPNEAVGRVVGQYMAMGTGAEIRLVEASTSTVMNSTPFALDDNSGAWEEFKFTTDQPPDGTYAERLYRLEGRLNGASEARIRFTSLSLLRVVVT